jgi:hypothetical protein
LATVRLSSTVGISSATPSTVSIRSLKIPVLQSDRPFSCAARSPQMQTAARCPSTASSCEAFDVLRRISKNVCFYRRLRSPLVGLKRTKFAVRTIVEVAVDYWEYEGSASGAQ